MNATLRAAERVQAIVQGDEYDLTQLGELDFEKAMAGFRGQPSVVMTEAQFLGWVDFLYLPGHPFTEDFGRHFLGARVRVV